MENNLILNGEDQSFANVPSDQIMELTSVQSASDPDKADINAAEVILTFEPSENDDTFLMTIKKYFTKGSSKFICIAKVIWAYFSLFWLAIFDEGTDLYGAYVHFG